MEKQPAKPGLLWSIFSMKCPRCRRGNMYNGGHPYKKLNLKHIFNMPERCNECNQKFDMEPGFWYGTGFVSYALAVAISVASFIAWWVIVGLSLKDDRVLYWLIFNGVLLVVIQPWLMRLSRVIYIYIFVKYDPNYKENLPQKFN